MWKTSLLGSVHTGIMAFITLIDGIEDFFLGLVFLGGFFCFYWRGKLQLQLLILRKLFHLFSNDVTFANRTL